MRRLVALPATLLAACAAPPAEAPAELADLGLFLFQHFEDEDTAELAAGILNLRAEIESDDLSVDAKDRAVTMPILEGESLGDLSIPDGVDAAEQVPVALTTESSHGLDAHRELAVEPNRICIESSTTVWATRTFDSDTGCFADGSCDRLDARQEVRKENILAKVWYDQLVTYRTLELEEEDGTTTRAMISRAWIEEVFEGDSGSSSWDQLFSLDVKIETADGALGWSSYWSSITLTALGDDAYANMVADGLQESADFSDEFMSNGSVESCPLDRNAEKPER